ncbi:alkaline phosphatase family protein [Siccirubricoccus sp. KC 17139]|uniref:Alkaline phosphatase family protein n=1 Tax=Siccirubricoccus soli TaxID=2899147 RepID=A0ABT1D1A1_9PROT|nr:alkaline phosphatase family protein [Siccirubricoccus soli]MCO6415654.1 alkaline phosphatase family protein [Siccirubricoccus soli]MCP2681786.1 alkaline phosphatase family protein [Siccirubricoccus soli]
MTDRLALLVILDGLRRDALSPERTPNLWRLMGRGTAFTGYRSMFPSATRIVSASTATGCLPASHGLAGNSLALLREDGTLLPLDAGDPGFLPTRRALRGSALDRPTLADRLAPHGGVAIFSNVSPGAALAHDPNRSGRLVQRAIAHEPGREAAPATDITLDAAGDARLTARFLEEGLGGALGLLWLGEPDASQHAHPLGSPAAWAAITAADTRLGEVMAAVDRRRTAGQEVLLLAGSDHGHETVEAVIDVEAELAAAGLDPGETLVTASNGTSVLVHLAPSRDPAPVLEFLRARPWVGTLLEGEALAAAGQRPGAEGLIAAIAMRRHGGVNQYGIPGMALAAKPVAGKPDRLGCGQHGGLGAAEQAPVMIADGPGFAPGGRDAAPARPIDLAPTLLAFLGHGDAGVPMDGRPLQSRPSQQPPG